ncbi:bifunctional DNA primase/polymerase [Paludisphaera rhizosphaerae]|uniref:bifunctional DNA primase/polymerase n=1 Tax=Paludisphaera rhizosphaerae TaxID=2711216 RepID=UPI0013EDED58|nr:bifunctional DNA primase/polymerase [Paludisphaera rhizosphaerae]
MTTYESALEYSQAGLRVVPCKPQSKEPLINDWPKRATTSPSQLRDWFEGHPERNIGLLTGGGVFAVDVDEEQGVKSLNGFVRGRSWPHTAMAETGNDGFHFLFRTNVQVPTQTGFRPGLDLRGESAKIVVAPSVHPDTGTVYRWISHPLDGIAIAPRWLQSWIVSESTATSNTPASGGSPLVLNHSGDVEALAADVIERFPVAQKGTRNAIMVKVLCSLLGRGQEAEVAAEVAIRWWQHFYDRGTIGTTPKEAARTIEKSIKSIIKSGSLQRAVSRDHSAKVAEQSLSPQQSAALGLSDQEANTHSLHTGLTTSLRSDLDRWFAEALLLHSQYEISKEPTREAIPFTSNQLRDLVETRHGRKLKDPEIERLKVKFVSRPDKPANRYELAEQTYTGSSYLRKPSELRLTGLQGLLPP